MCGNVQLVYWSIKIKSKYVPIFLYGLECYLFPVKYLRPISILHFVDFVVM